MISVLLDHQESAGTTAFDDGGSSFVNVTFEFNEKKVCVRE